MSTFGHGEALKDGNAAVLLEEAVYTSEISSEEFLPDSFKHLDRDNLIVRPIRYGQLAVVHEEDLDAIRQTGLGDSSLGERLLLLGQSYTRYVASRLSGGGDGKRPPPG